MTDLVTANGKELKIVIDPKTAHYKIQFASGGELPQALSGLYTSSGMALKDAIGYVEKSKVKEVAQEQKLEKQSKKSKEE